MRLEPQARAPARRRRVAIVGGGLSGLCAAYELTRTPELAARHEVTIYQMGWRVGGKLASGRNPRADMRNEEHGLHVWFGFYDNAFRLAREVYERWQAPPDCPFESVWDALTPQAYAPFGVEKGDGFEPWHYRFARNAAVPGTSDSWTPFELLSMAVGQLRSQLPNLWGRSGIAPDDAGSQPQGRWERSPTGPLPAHAARIDKLLQRLGKRLGRIFEDAQAPSRAAVRSARLLARTLQRTAVPVLLAVARRRPQLHNFACTLEFFCASVLGILDPRYGVLEDLDLDRLNHLELRDWLCRHGATRALADDWALIRVAYDATFQYLGGDPNRPNFEAGTAVRFLLRAMFGYRNAAAFLINAGMGEAFIAPLFEVLRAQGVRFEFFHRLQTLQLNDASTRVDALVFERQAQVNSETYEPLVTHGGLRCWLTEPDWSQLVDGDVLREQGVRFESRFGPHAAGATRKLYDGADFDEVILALPAGALRATPDAASCVEPLLEHQPQLRQLANSMNLTPSIAAQLWCDASTAGLGWQAPRPAMAGWASPLSVWADMTPVIQHEGWQGTPPKSTHYLCGAWHTDLHRAAGGPEVSAQAKADAHADTVDQLARHAVGVWPASASADGDFDWGVLHDPLGRTGPSRVHAQYVSANIEPSDLCDGAAVGTSALRPEAHESGLTNVVLAGTWTRTSINSTCVEAATMSGLAAARVLTGPIRPIWSEFFMQRPRPVVHRTPHPVISEDIWTVS